VGHRLASSGFDKHSLAGITVDLGGQGQGMNQQDFEFRLREYDALRAEMRDMMKAQDSRFTFTLVSVAALTSWIVTNTAAIDPAWRPWIAWLPYLIALFFSMRRKDGSKGIKRLGLYIYKLEEVLASDGKGWEHGFAIESFSKSRGAFNSVKYTYWFLLLSTFIFGLIYSHTLEYVANIVSSFIVIVTKVAR